MRKILFLVCCFFLLQNARSQSTGKAFTFTGTIKGMPAGYVYLNYIDSTDRYIQDSSKIANGNFSFKGYINSPHQAELITPAANGETGHPQQTYLFLGEGTTQGSFSANNFKNNQLKGSESVAEYALYEAQESRLRKKWKPDLDAQQAYNKGIDKEKNYIIWNNAAPQFQKEKREMDQQFIRQHPQSYVSACLMRGMLFKLSFDSLKSYHNLLSPEVQKGTEGRIVGKFIRKEESIAVGKPAPDFAQPDSSGAPVWLHDFKGQYVLLDFWASWCVPCRQEHPNLRQAYAKFKNKGFTILSVSMDEERFKEAWVKAIQKDSLTWPQLCDFTAWTNKVVDAYNVLGKGIPASFLINPQGTIIAMNLRGEALEKKLTELITD